MSVSQRSRGSPRRINGSNGSKVSSSSSSPSSSSSSGPSTPEDDSGLPWHKVPADVRENYVLTGYRPVSMGIFPCLRSAFLLHNETLNIWTHMLPLFYFLYFMWADAEMWVDMNLAQDQRFPLYGYILGICILFGTSASAHWFNCVSWHWRHVFFMMDYGAISVYGVATAVVYYAYSQNMTPLISNGSGYFLALTVSTAIFATWTCCWTRVNHAKMPNICHAVRTLSFGLPFIIGSIPAMVRFVGPNISHIDLSGLPQPLQQTIAGHRHLVDSDATFQYRYVRHLVLMVIGAIIQIAKVPERWFPGYFDIFGHSHQWFHLFVFLSIREQFWLVIGDIGDARHKGSLTASSSTLSTVLVYFVCFSTVLATVTYFSYYSSEGSEPTSFNSKKEAKNTSPKESNNVSPKRSKHKQKYH